MDNFENKYLKYKNKIINLKEQQGGKYYKCHNPNALKLSQICKESIKKIKRIL